MCDSISVKRPPKLGGQADDSLTPATYPAKPPLCPPLTIAPQTRTKTVQMSYPPLCSSSPIIKMQPTPCARVAAHPYFITHTNGDNTMQHQNPMCFQMDFDFDTALPHFVRSPVRNNAPFTCKIPFRTAP